MYLQSLELIGFKSFVTKTVLEFHRGVTAIVGPNGCGKSNVLDAIRWVLGEQSAKALRGGEMADVIFSGTDDRPALGMAEVSMTFADCEKELGVEWNEVRVTRRVFRDGKGEYLLNKTPCRLKDIHQLFMDTGIGRSAYSIMEQGKIDLILSSRPEDRRAIFEEAAGITKYKAQKKEALRKLEYTEANLLRVGDIIKEVKRQIGSLQRQAGKARRYQALMSALKVFDTHLSHRNYTAFADELAAVRAELAGVEKSRAIHEEEIEAQEGELTGFRDRMTGLDEEIGAVRDTVQTLRNRMLSAEHRIESHGHRCGEFAELIERHRSDISAAEEKIRDQESLIQETDSQIQELLDAMRTSNEALAAQQALVESLRAERNTALREQQAAAQEVSRIEGEINKLQGDASGVAARREAAESRLATLDGESNQSASALEDIQRRMREADQRLAALAASLDAARAGADEAAAAHTAARSALADAGQKHTGLERQIAELESKLEVLRRLEASGEGLGEATQAVLGGLDNPEFYQPAIAGAMASLIEVEPRFVHAIEAALGASLQAIVFKDAEVARQALETLSGKDLGRGVLMPRDWISTPAYEVTRTLPDGAIGWAAACVRGTDELRPLLGRLLDGVVVVESLEQAFHMRSSHPGLAFVTTNGEFVSREGLAHAGKGGGNAASALLRKNEIHDLEAQTAATRSALEQLTRQREAAREACDNAEAVLGEAGESVRRIEVGLSTARGERSLLDREEQDARKRSEILAGESEATRAQIGEADRRSAEIQSRADELHARRNELESGRAGLDNRLEELNTAESAAAGELSALQLRVVTEKQQRESLQRQREPMAARLHELAELIGQRSTDITNYEQRIASLEGESAELRESIAESTEELRRTEDEAARLTTQRNEVRESAEALDTALRLARKQLSDLQEKRGNLEIRASQIEMKMEHLRDHVSRRYTVDLSGFEPDIYALRATLKEQKLKASDDVETVEPAEVVEPAEPAEETPMEPIPATAEQSLPWDRIEEVVAEMTERIDSMGPVNLDAIQEFDELEERAKFLDQQCTDLTNSKAELLEVISKINRTTRELFAETFEKIRGNFQEMFTELFGGGKANLLLSDESDPLECGIEIIAKPPGKQLQSISLLSGGERTMTAVALLFSIYMVKPSPFCVLDEMDAPLDESNISRFIKILNRFVEQSQFVVITHNKRTISRADMLYGVTMEEHGVSKIVSVKFHNKPDTNGHANGNGNGRSVAESFGKSESTRSETDEPALAG